MYRTFFKQEYKDGISKKMAHVFKLVFCKRPLFIMSDIVMSLPEKSNTIWDKLLPFQTSDAGRTVVPP